MAPMNTIAKSRWSFDWSFLTLKSRIQTFLLHSSSLYGDMWHQLNPAHFNPMRKTRTKPEVQMHLKWNSKTCCQKILYSQCFFPLALERKNNRAFQLLWKSELHSKIWFVLWHTHLLKIFLNRSHLNTYNVLKYVLERTQATPTVMWVGNAALLVLYLAC